MALTRALPPFPPRWDLDRRHVEIVHLLIGAPAPGAHEPLSPDERARAARFLFERDRIRYVNARAALRRLLGSCLGIGAGAVRFSYGDHGKPAAAVADASIRFNLSHSGDHALVALTVGRDVGVDLEQVRADVDHAGIARGLFTERERAAIEARSGPERAMAFFRCWVAKEAYLKARGEGLAAPLAAFEVEVAPHPEALRWTSLEAAGRAWRIRPLEAAPGHVAALACEAGDWAPRHWSGLEEAPASCVPFICAAPAPAG